MYIFDLHAYVFLGQAIELFSVCFLHACLRAGILRCVVLRHDEYAPTAAARVAFAPKVWSQRQLQGTQHSNDVVARRIMML